MVDLRDATAARERASQASVGELVQAATTQTAELVRQELQLAQAELKQKGRQMSAGAAVVAAGGLVALYGLGALVAAAVLGLATVVDGWLAALLVGGVLVLVGAVAALVGMRRTRRALPAAPEQTIESVHEDVEHIKEQAAR